MQSPSGLGGRSSFWDGAPTWPLAVLQESPQDRAAGFPQSEPQCFG